MEQFDRHKIPNEMNKKQEIIETLFADNLKTVEEIENIYPPRVLQEGSKVTRVGPSPTGFMHIGGLYAALISERVAHQSPGGIFYLRVEDTDKAREVEGATELIINSFDRYGIRLDEGPSVNSTKDSTGDYGPYIQSERKDIYRSMVKSLVDKDFAYPCFCSPEELNDIKQEQENLKLKPGYYGEWAKWRDASIDQVQKELLAGKEFVIRLKSNGIPDDKFIFHDSIKGDKELPVNDQDIVILKSDGLPTYHLAHVVDDHLMGTTDVIRGDEWFISSPIHLELFKTFGWTPPNYGHIAPIQKKDGDSKRKLSKRKDAEANIAYYDNEGFPSESIIEYLLNLANSNFEDWRKANPNVSNKEFPFSFEKLAHSSGPLFDSAKLNDISKDVISKMTAEEILKEGIKWAEAHDEELKKLLKDNLEYSLSIFNIERTGSKKVRKDISRWKDMRYEVLYFFDALFKITKEEICSLLNSIDIKDIKQITSEFLTTYDSKDTNEEWFAKLKEIAVNNRFSIDSKVYRNDPSAFKGQISDVAKILRVLITGRTNTPDLYTIMKVLGEDRIVRRLGVVEHL